jgi:hypothetical protein
VDAALQVGQVSEKIEVSSNALHVDTVSSQMGEVIEGKEMTDVPLVTRSYTDLLALQPGVVSSPSGLSGAYGGSFVSAGFPVPPVSGDLNSGALSVDGMRESANAFILNGVLVQEVGYSGAGAIPNLDSIAEFRILTNNTDAEYGNYAGAQINVVTKSGTNQWHGNAFEFLRNTDLDAKNYFDVNGRGAYNQNQFGGTFGGPVNGNYFFGSSFSGQPSETGSDFVDFLLGAPASYVQGQSYPSYGRSFYLGFYGQDSWRATSNLTLNFGLRYDVSSPWWEKYNEIQTLIPGEQSVVFPGSPKGWVFPGDPGVPRTLAPTRWNNFGPPFGLAYALGDHEGMLGKLFGKAGA